MRVVLPVDDSKAAASNDPLSGNPQTSSSSSSFVDYQQIGSMRIRDWASLYGFSVTKVLATLKRNGFLGKVASSRMPIEAVTCLVSEFKLKKEEAIQWYRLGAEKGFAEAQYALGNCYFKGDGVNQNYAEAVKWYQSAAKQGNAKAQNKTGDCYLNGVGVQEDKNEAIKWYRMSAEKGNADAQFNLGSCYYSGNGVKQDYSEAVKWYQAAAKQGDAYAQFNLGVCYFNGRGTEINDSIAVKWYRLAAEHGHPDAQYWLGYCYSKGRGVSQNESQAVKWYRKAADRGQADAKRWLNNVCPGGENASHPTKEKSKTKPAPPLDFFLQQPLITKHGINQYQRTSYGTYSIRCTCGIIIDYPDLMSGLSVSCPACGRTVNIPGQKKQTFTTSDKSSLTHFQRGLWYYDKKFYKNYVQAPIVFLEQINKSYNKCTVIDYLIVISIMTLSVCSFFLLKNFNMHPLLYIFVLTIGSALSYAAHKLIKYDVTRDLFPLLKYQSNDSTSYAFEDFISFCLDSMRKISVYDMLDKKSPEQEYKKKALSSNPKILSYQFGGNTQMLLFPDQALILYNGKFRLAGFRSIDLRIMEEIGYSSRITDYSYHWLHQRRDGGPDRRYKENYQIKSPCRYGFDLSYSYHCKLIVDGIICFEGNHDNASLLNKIIAQWNNASF